MRQSGHKPGHKTTNHTMKPSRFIILDSMYGFVVWPGYTQPERLHATGPLGTVSEIRHGVRFFDTVLTRCSSDACADSSVLDVGRLYTFGRKPRSNRLARMVHT